MDVRDIVDLVNLVSAKDISELEVERDGVRVRIVKSPGAGTLHRSYETPAASRPHSIAVEHVLPMAGGAGQAASSSATGFPAQHWPPAASTPALAPGAADWVPEEEGVYLMRSPIVGTFYRSPSPAAEPYVSASDRVKKGQVLCIVEAMKLMNEIESEVGGTVLEILVEDGQPVEYGEPLYKIRPDR